jgi:spoIIIJ-associated protein
MHEAIQAILKEILDSMGVAYTAVEQSEIAGQTIFTIKTDDARTLIGPHGDAIYALDMLVKKIAERRMPKASEETASEDSMHFLVDVNDYRAKQIKDLQTKALMMAERARSFQYDVELTPMSAYERLIIHTTLQDAPNVKTESQGEGRNRRVVIKYSAD